MEAQPEPVVRPGFTGVSDRPTLPRGAIRSMTLSAPLASTTADFAVLMTTLVIACCIGIDAAGDQSTSASAAYQPLGAAVTRPRTTPYRRAPVTGVTLTPPLALSCTSACPSSLVPHWPS